MQSFEKSGLQDEKRLVRKNWGSVVGLSNTIYTPTGVAPYSLVYSIEAVLTLERELPSLIMVILEGLTN